MDFDTTVALDAVQCLERSRSQILNGSLDRQRNSLQTRINKSSTVWDIKPVDFSARLYQKNLINRNYSKEKNSIQQPRKGAHYHQHRSQNEKTSVKTVCLPKLQLPSLLLEQSKPTEDSFITFFRPLSPQAFKVHSIRKKTIEKDKYLTDSNAYIRRDHFRPIEDYKKYSKYGIEDFKTSFSPDPFEIKFKNEMLSRTLPDLSTTKQIDVRTCESEPIPQPEKLQKWEKNIYLQKSAYRRGTSRGDALIQRVQAHLPWLTYKQRANNVQRPDVEDYTTEDWCRVTKAPLETDGPFSMA